MKKITSAEWILRIGIFGSFLGHGIFALQIKEGWFKYFTAVGMTDSMATQLLPMIGALDVTVAILAMLWPMRLVLIWATAWGFFTALLRPIAKEPVWDFVERWANWAAPLALLALQGFPKSFKDLFRIK